MAHLYKHLRIHQVFGANTDVGKTVLTAALCRTAAASKHVYYLKPLSTGHPADADDGHILRHAGPSHGGRIRADCLYRYSDPVSPHLAARRDQSKPAPTDAEFVRSISNHIRKCAADHAVGAMFVETAGGVHSPTLLGTIQADAYRPLLLPTILVADPRLGGISSTISAYESLILRGYSIDLVLCMLDPADSKAYLNHEYLEPWFAEKGITVCAPPFPPPRARDPSQDRMVMEAYYVSIADESGAMHHAEKILANTHVKRLEELDSMPGRASNTFWWPFVQHDFVKDPKRDITTIDSAHGDSFSVHSESTSTSTSQKSLLKRHLDGSASWWTQSFGHSHPRLALAAAHAAGRYGHVLFPLAVHAPALELAERLVKGPGAGWADRVFYSDDGSTAVEVALKMAVRAVALRRREGQTDDSLKTELGVLGIKGSYHGDTIGAMDACEGGVYNASVEWHRERGFWFDPPTVGVHGGTVRITTPSMSGSNPQQVTFPTISGAYDVQSRLNTPLAETYRKHIRGEIERRVNQGQRFGALMVEPIILGAGGMLFVDPLFQRILVETVRSSSDLFQTSLSSTTAGWTGLPIIFDEVFTGFHRLGPLTSSSLLGVTPDIAVYAKILTGGVVPLSATLATNSIFSAFNFPGAKKIDALLHGHSYSAHPVGCAVATAAMDEMKIVTEGDGWKRAKERCEGGLYALRSRMSGGVWTLWDPNFVAATSRSKRVEQAMSLGTVFAMTLRDAEGGESLAGILMQSGLKPITTGYQATIAQDFIASVQHQLSKDGGEFGLNARTLGDVVYFMGSLNTDRSAFGVIENAVLAVLEDS